MSTQSDINLADLWNPAFNEVWNKIAPYVIGKDARGDAPPSEYDEVFLMGGRASGKSYFAAVIMWLVLENDPKKNGVVVRKVGSSIRKSCWKQMMRIRKRLGFFHWEPNKTDMTFTNSFTGQQIFMCGLDDEEKVRSIAVENGYISIIWFEEAKQFKNMEEIDEKPSLPVFFAGRPLTPVGQYLSNLHKIDTFLMNKGVEIDILIFFNNTVNLRLLFFN